MLSLKSLLSLVFRNTHPANFVLFPMGLHNAEALILEVTDLHDRDRIVTFLTREQGKRRGVAKGARTKHSRFGGQLQPLAKAEITWFEKEGRDLIWRWEQPPNPDWSLEWEEAP